MEIAIYGELPGGEEAKLQEKDVEITENGQTIITPDTEFNGLSKVNVDVKVPDSSDYSIVGTTLDVEAQTTIAKGSKIVGIKNDEYVTPTLASTAHGLPNLLVVSDDLSVAICGANSSSTVATVGNDYVYTFYFRDENTGVYGNPYTLTLENYPSNIKCMPAPVINKQGTLAMTSAIISNNPNNSDGAILLIFDINKENYTVSYTYKSIADWKLPVAVYTDTYYMSPIGIEVFTYRSSDAYTYTYGGIVDNLIFGLIWHRVKNKSDDSVVASVSDSCAVLKYENGELTVEAYDVPYARIITSNAFNIGNVRQIDENNFIFCRNSNGLLTGGRLYRYNISEKKFYLGASGQTSFDVHTSPNGRYACRVYKNSTGSEYTVTKYEINPVDLSATEVYKHIFSISSPTSNTIYTSHINNDGSAVYTDTGYLLDLTRETVKGSPAGVTNKIVTETFNDAQFITRTNIHSYTPGTEAEYLISETNSTDCSTPDRIYGIASQDLAVGTRGEARGLFSTFS